MKEWKLVQVGSTNQIGKTVKAEEECEALLLWGLQQLKSVPDAREKTKDVVKDAGFEMVEVKEGRG